MPPVNSKFFGTPSTNSSHDNLPPSLSSFLSNKNHRKLYLKVLDYAKKLAKVNAKLYFLQKCIEEKVFPRTLRIPNMPGDENPTPEWTAATEIICLERLKQAIAGEEISREMAKKFIDIAAFTENNKLLLEQLADKLKSKCAQFEMEQMVLKDEKLKKLKNPPKKLNKKQNEKRKWVPKNKYKRLMNQLEKLEAAKAA